MEPDADPPVFVFRVSRHWPQFRKNQRNGAAGDPAERPTSDGVTGTVAPSDGTVTVQMPPSRRRRRQVSTNSSVQLSTASGVPGKKTKEKPMVLSNKPLIDLDDGSHDRASPGNTSFKERVMAQDGYTSSLMSEEEDTPSPHNVGASGFGSTHPPSSPSHTEVRRRQMPYHTMSGGHAGVNQETEPGYVLIPRPENPVEAQRLVNNYMFGFKKWKGHVTERPLEVRSDIVKELYSDTQKVSEVSTLRPGNVVYLVMFGWWIALIYLLVALLMAVTIIGMPYAKFCLTLGSYFLWPFGKFVHKDCDGMDNKQEQSPLIERATFQFSSSEQQSDNGGIREEIPLIGRRRVPESSTSYKGFWRRPRTYVWIILGFPLLVIIHSIAFLISWLLVIFIPIAKINSKAIRKILLIEPEHLSISKSSYMVFDVGCLPCSTPSEKSWHYTNLQTSSEHPNTDIVTYTHQAVNIYYYKYTIDGMNVIAVTDLLVFVLVALMFGYLDPSHKITSPTSKFVLSLFAIIPLAYYIGMGITSLAAQTNFAIGAVLNATFGTAVEITLYILALLKGKELGVTCYQELVKASLVGTLLATMMLVPGLCMVIGGFRHSNQAFNPHSAGVSSTLLFVSVAGAFAPTIFSKAFGRLECFNCMNSSVPVLRNGTNETHYQWSLKCQDCNYETARMNHTSDLYMEHVRPLVHTCALLLPVAYIIGLIFSLKTHRTQIHDAFMAQLQEGDGENGNSLNSHGHSVAHWGRIKSLIILLVSTVLMSLCADLITENIEVLIKDSPVTVYFIGVTLLAIVPNMPEIVNGMQFALQNNISLSIEVGCSIALQVCLLQIPILVFFNLIVPMDFTLVFDDIHLWAVVFAVLMMNYVFQDGKADYFQGSAVCLVYLAIIAIYFFAPVTPTSKC